MKKTYAVIGLGRFGTAVAERLYALGNEVLVIDDDAERVQRMESRVTYAVVADARDEAVLRSLGMRNYDCAIVAIGTDLAASIVITMNLKELGVPQVVCKAEGDMQKRALEKIGADKVRAELAEYGVAGDAADKILAFIGIGGSNDEVLAVLRALDCDDATFREGVEELDKVVHYAYLYGIPEKNIAIDLTIARGLDYYTGTVYETVMLDHPEIGSICSGGRYDNLAEYYTDKQLPGVGISIGLTRLFYVLGEQGMLNPELPTAPADVLILPMTEDLSPAIALATQLRQAGIRTQLHCEQKKFKAKISYADKLSIPYVIFLGEDEINAGVVACKDMKSGEQTKLNTQETIDRIKAGLAELEKGSVIVE